MWVKATVEVEGRQELEETEKRELTLGCSVWGLKCTGGGSRRSRELLLLLLLGDTCVCYLVSLVLVLLEVNKTRRSKKDEDEMKRRKALGRFTSVSDSCRGKGSVKKRLTF